VLVQEGLFVVCWWWCRKCGGGAASVVVVPKAQLLVFWCSKHGVVYENSRFDALPVWLYFITIIDYRSFDNRLQL